MAIVWKTCENCSISKVRNTSILTRVWIFSFFIKEIDEKANKNQRETKKSNKKLGESRKSLRENCLKGPYFSFNVCLIQERSGTTWACASPPPLPTLLDQSLFELRPSASAHPRERGNRLCLGGLFGLSGC